jgi:GntR family transcriptional repressor for pyruvate dehydrogenase complex
MNRGGALTVPDGPAGPDRDLSRVLEQVLDGGPSPVLGPVRAVTVADGVADRLLTAIAVGDFLPGERLPVERDLCGLLQVSRSTVREAIARLQAAGVLEIRRGRSGGAYVRESWTDVSAAAVRRTLLPRWEELEQLFDLRGLVDGMVAGAAARRRRPEHVEQMREALAGYATANGPRAEQLADGAFHQAVCQATGNPQIVGLSRDLLTRVSLGFPVEPWGRGEPSSFPRALREHTELYEAIAAGEPERAEEIARGHFAITAGMIRDVLTRGLAVEQPGTSPSADGT